MSFQIQTASCKPQSASGAIFRSLVQQHPPPIPLPSPTHRAPLKARQSGIQWACQALLHAIPSFFLLSLEVFNVIK